MATFVNATKKIIETEGMDSVSIRRVSSAAGYSSATLYLYFEDIHELVTMSLISSLDSYVSDIIRSTPENESSKDEYLRTWRVFCTHALTIPSVFLNLFFGPQSDKMDVIAKKYYELFPDELEHASGRMLEMFASGSLSSRNHVILDSFAAELGLSEEETSLANDLTIAYFHSFLLNACTSDHNLSPTEVEELVKRFIKGALFILRTPDEQ